MTSDKHPLAGLLMTSLMAAVLASCLELTDSQSTAILRFSPCSAEGSVFAELPFDKWAETYHGDVSSVVEAHISTSQNMNTTKLQCTADDYAGLLEPSPALKSLSQKLPEWKTDEKQAALSEADMGAVLLEYLRVYECSMNEYYSKSTLRTLSGSSAPTNIGGLIQKQGEAKKKIEDEKMIARRSLDRTLELLGGYDRFRPLSADIECLKRTSLDLRNVLGLTSEASACLPRVLDAHGSLRDPPEEE